MFYHKLDHRRQLLKVKVSDVDLELFESLNCCSHQPVHNLIVVEDTEGGDELFRGHLMDFFFDHLARELGELARLNWYGEQNLQLFNELVCEEDLSVVKFAIFGHKVDISVDKVLGTGRNKSFLLDRGDN